MPLPRYQQIKKKAKTQHFTLNLNDLDDFCLAKIIGHVLNLSSSRSGNHFELNDTLKAEKNLSLVSKRWYYLTKSQSPNHGVYKISLKHHSGNSLHKSQLKSTTTTIDYNIKLYKLIQDKLFKYKHIIIEGCLKVNEFYQLIVAIDAARIERLKLDITFKENSNLNEEKVNLFKSFTNFPKQLIYLKHLTIIWNTNYKDHLFANLLIWSIYEKAANLKTLLIYLDEQAARESPTSGPDENQLTKLSFKKIEFLKEDKILELLNNQTSSNQHDSLNTIIFNRSATNSNSNSNRNTSANRYANLIKNVIVSGKNINEIETNDNFIIEYLINSSDRICTSKQLNYLKFSSSIRNLNLLAKLLKAKNLGRNFLSIVIDEENTDNQLDEIRQLIQNNFKSFRHSKSICKICLYLKDQKSSSSDCGEDKIKNLIQLSRQGELMVYVNAIQRVSIDCCHLMWSVGRALQQQTTTIAQNMPDSSTGKCIFKITIQPSSANSSSSSSSSTTTTQITVPFGNVTNFEINSNREDITKHREILKSLKKNCYNQFVKSIRDH